MATLLPLPFAFSARFPVSLAAYSVESRLPVSLPLEPFLPRSFPLRTVPTMLATAAFYLSRTPALHRAACVFTSLAPPLLLPLPLAAALGGPRPCQVGAPPSRPTHLSHR